MCFSDWEWRDGSLSKLDCEDDETSTQGTKNQAKLQYAASFLVLLIVVQIS